MMAVARSGAGESPWREVLKAGYEVNNVGVRNGVGGASNVAMGVNGVCAGRVARARGGRLCGGVVKVCWKSRLSVDVGG